MIISTWAEFKSMLDSGIGFNMHEEDDKIDLFIANSSLRYSVSMRKTLVNKTTRIEYANPNYTDFDTNYRSKLINAIETFYSREPFATKVLKDGSKLFRRKHGFKVNMLANSETTHLVNMPYDKCKINKLEIIDANALDRVDLIILDTPSGLISGIPDYTLNQFGFDVVVCDLLYSDKSDYDADLYKDMKVKIVYKNDTNADKIVGINVVFHQIV